MCGQFSKLSRLSSSQLFLTTSPSGSPLSPQELPLAEARICRGMCDIAIFSHLQRQTALFLVFRDEPRFSKLQRRSAFVAVPRFLAFFTATNSCLCPLVTRASFFYWNHNPNYSPHGRNAPQNDPFKVLKKFDPKIQNIPPSAGIVKCKIYTHIITFVYKFLFKMNLFPKYTLKKH